jgi:putative membrane protein (TIGR04086 family)
LATIILAHLKTIPYPISSRFAQQKGTIVLPRIHWLRVILTAILVEVVLLVIAIPLNMSANGRAILLVLVIPLCVIGTFLGGWWVGRRTGSLFLVHGLLVGAVAALIYAALTLKVSLPTAYIVANYLKLIAGAAGGIAAQSLRRANPNRI